VGGGVGGGVVGNNAIRLLGGQRGPGPKKKTRNKRACFLGYVDLFLFWRINEQGKALRQPWGLRVPRGKLKNRTKTFLAGGRASLCGGADGLCGSAQSTKQLESRCLLFSRPC
jgi:hypothetical protein